MRYCLPFSLSSVRCSAVLVPSRAGETSARGISMAATGGSDVPVFLPHVSSIVGARANHPARVLRSVDHRYETGNFHGVRVSWSSVDLNTPAVAVAGGAAAAAPAGPGWVLGQAYSMQAFGPTAAAPFQLPQGGRMISADTGQSIQLRASNGFAHGVAHVTLTEARGALRRGAVVCAVAVVMQRRHA